MLALSMSLRPKQHLGALLGTLLVAGLIWQLTTTDKPSHRAVRQHENLPFGEMDDFVYTRTTGGQVQYRIAAKTAQYFDERDVVEFTGVSATALHEGRRFKLTGARGSVELASRQGTIEGDVVATTDDEMTLRTQRLSFDGAAQTVFTDAPVKLTGPTIDVEAIGADLSLEERKVKLRSGVKARLWSAN